MKLNHSLKLFYTSPKIVGVILIIIGLVFFSSPTSLNLKIGFTSILIGILIIFLITKKSNLKKICDLQLQGNTEAIRKIIRELNLKGNAIIIPKTDDLTEERIVIPPKNIKTFIIPKIKNDNVFLKGLRNKNLGMVLPPSGLQLLKDLEEEEKFKINNIDDIEKKLQIFVGMDFVKSLSFKKVQNIWQLELEKPIFCSKDFSFCKQYPCPTCSTILVALSRILNNPELRLRIKDTMYNGGKITFYLNFIKRKQNRVNKKLTKSKKQRKVDKK